MLAVTWGAYQLITRRKQLPFGAPRATTGTDWPGDRGFVGGTTDPTGYTHLGAREYDPTLGRFLSVDPPPHRRPHPAQPVHVRQQQPGDVRGPDG
ncbi:RHS repeat-associated core domain-containing protein [Actinomadura keratinilytica]